LISAQATTLAFALLALTKHPTFQGKLRAEVHFALETSAGNVVRAQAASL
jgi:cytochrome P450